MDDSFKGFFQLNKGCHQVFMIVLMFCFLSLFPSYSCADDIRNNLNALYDQKTFVNLNFDKRKTVIDFLYNNLEALNETEQLQFYFLTSQTLKHETTQQIVDIIDQGLVLAEKLENKNKALYFSMLKLRLSPQTRDDTYIRSLIQIKSEVDKIPDSIEKVMAYLDYARINDELTNRFEQLSALHKGLEIVELLMSDRQDYAFNFMLGELNNQLGIYYVSMDQYEKAEQFYFNALGFFTNINFQSKIGIVKFNLAMWAYEQNDYEKAVEYFNEVIALKEKLNERYGLALSHLYIGVAKNEMGQAEQAILHLEISIPILLDLNSKYRLAPAYINLGIAKHALNQFEQADDAVLKSLALAETHLPQTQRMKVFQTAKDLLSSPKYNQKKQLIAAKIANMQSTVTTDLKNDLNARIEAEAKFQKQLQQVKLLSWKTHVQQASNELQKKWIWGLILLVIILVYIMHKQIKANRDKTTLVNTDDLTGISNRRYFYKVCEGIHHKKNKANHNHYLLLFDIDFFKSINDKFGHIFGDWVLVELSKLIKNITQFYCANFARIGGEEFALVCQFEDQNSAIQFANEIRTKVATHDWKKSNNLIDLDITISIGVTMLIESLSVDELINRADKALYKAKENGRNRVEV